MTRRTALRSLALLIAVILSLSACSGSNTPGSWAEAEEQGDSITDYPVRNNFLDACNEANSGEKGFNEAQANNYCVCSFDAIRKLFDDSSGVTDGNNPDKTPFELFLDFERDLRDNPDVVPELVTNAYVACADQVN